MKFSRLLLQTIGWSALASLRRVSATGLIRQLLHESIRRKIQKTPFRILLSPVAVRGYDMLASVAKAPVRITPKRVLAAPVLKRKQSQVLAGTAVGFVAAAAGICALYYFRKK